MRRAARTSASGTSSALKARHVVAAVAFMLVAAAVGLSIGSVHVPITAILSDVAWRLGVGGHPMGPVDSVIVWTGCYT